MKTAIALIGACLLLLGCDKFRRISLKDHPELVGKFEWMESVVDSATTKTPAGTGQQYRIVLVEKGKVYVYKDNTPSSKGYVYAIQQMEGGQLFVRMMLDNKKEFNMSFNGSSELYSPNYPFVCIRNTFLKQ